MIVLEGCRRAPLGSYLQALGVWRAVVRLLDSNARGQWSRGRFILTTSVAADELVDRLAERFEPLPIVSPWNEGAGFKPGGTPARTLAEVAAQADPRWVPVQRAITAAQEVVRRGLAAGWGSAKGKELWDKTRKAEVIQLCRNTLPDDVLLWLDAAIVLRHDSEGGLDITFNRLLGTGANLGRQDLQTTYLQRALALYANAKTRGRNRDWLRAALHGDEDVPYLREAVGQFDPGRAGGIQSSPAEKADDSGFANPWAFLLAVEGTLLFASAATRRQGARNAGASVPFTVRATAAGYGSAAAGETSLGELWAPEWDRPAALQEIAHLLSEGRADWNGGPARSGLDFVRAIADLGVDRGIRRFTRHVFAERLGQSPLSVPVSVVEVESRGAVQLLGQLDPWMNRIRDVAKRSAAVEAGLRSLEQTMFDQAAGRGTLLDVVVAMGRLHQAVSRSGVARGMVPAWTFRDPVGWCHELEPHADPELRLAIALASGRDQLPKQGESQSRHAELRETSLRELLSPVQRDRSGRYQWTEGAAPVPTEASLVTALAAAHHRRSQPRQADDPADVQPAVRGVLTAFRRACPAPMADLVAFTEDRLDDERLRDLLAGLILLDGAWPTAASKPNTATQKPPYDELVPPALALLVPFYSVCPLSVRLRRDDEKPTPVLLRPSAGWAAQLAAGAVDAVLSDAVSRLRVAGVPGVIDPAPSVGLDGERLAAALLIPLTSGDRLYALASIANLPSNREGAMT